MTANQARRCRGEAVQVVRAEPADHLAIRQARVDFELFDMVSVKLLDRSAERHLVEYDPPLTPCQPLILSSAVEQIALERAEAIDNSPVPRLDQDGLVAGSK